MGEGVVEGGFGGVGVEGMAWGWGEKGERGDEEDGH